MEVQLVPEEKSEEYAKLEL